MPLQPPPVPSALRWSDAAAGSSLSGGTWPSPIARLSDAWHGPASCPARGRRTTQGATGSGARMVSLLHATAAVVGPRGGRDKVWSRVGVGSEGDPPDSESLVTGVNVGAGTDKKVRFLRAIPTEPMTNQKDWGKRCVSDDPDSTSWCGKNVFD